ncbi:MAG: membrane protein [Candidatus Woesearchaeota archaeon]|nr:MAG: membrane protein [Candidatus Woesearchaeota archaeon]
MELILEVLLSIIVGIITGIFTGLTPGIHINMVAMMVLLSSPFLLEHFSPLTLGIFIISLGITHTFLDSLPSIFFGAPDENNILGVLPGHRYLLRGNGLMAVKLFSIGSFLGLIFGIILFPIFYIITINTYGFFEKYFAYILIFVIIFMIFKDNKKAWSIVVIILSGTFGMIVFNLNIKDPLFPMLSGLFGISTLIISYFDNNNIPKQNIQEKTNIDRKKTFLSVLAGNIGSFIVSTFPGLSSSIAAVISMQFIKDLGDKGFMILMGCIGTCSFMISLVALLAVDKARNGAIIAIYNIFNSSSESLELWIIIVFLIVSLIAGAISFIISIKIGVLFSKLITKIDYKMLIITIILFITIMVLIINSWIGLLVLITSTAIGIIPGITKIQRTHSMSCLMIPVIMYLI